MKASRRLRGSRGGLEARQQQQTSELAPPPSALDHPAHGTRLRPRRRRREAARRQRGAAVINEITGRRAELGRHAAYVGPDALLEARAFVRDDVQQVADHFFVSQYRNMICIPIVSQPSQSVERP